MSDQLPTHTSDDSKLCEWCGMPTGEEGPLCRMCAEARQKAEQGQLILAGNQLPSTRRAESGLGRIAMNVLKVLGAAVFSALLVMCAAAGTCAAAGIVVAGTQSSVGGVVMMIMFATIFLGVAALMAWLIYLMYKDDIKQVRKKELK